MERSKQEEEKEDRKKGKVLEVSSRPKSHKYTAASFTHAVGGSRVGREVASDQRKGTEGAKVVMCMYEHY